jgi:hypothetical protein
METMSTTRHGSDAWKGYKHAFQGGTVYEQIIISEFSDCLSDLKNAKDLQDCRR